MKTLVTLPALAKLALARLALAKSALGPDVSCHSKHLKQLTSNKI